MMRLPSFRYYAPSSVKEASRILAQEGPDAKIVAGGTDLFPNMKRRHQTPKTLVSLRRIRELRGISGSPVEGVRIGSCTTLADVITDPTITRSYRALAHAAGVVSTPLLRNMGTIGGNICLDTRCNYYDQNWEWRRAIRFCLKCEGDTCWVAPSSDTCLAVNSSDTAPLLFALGATVHLVSHDGERELLVREMYRKDGIHYLTKRSQEILTEIRLPAANGWTASYVKLARRGAFDFPVLGVAAVIRRDGDGTITDAKIVFNAVASCPVEAVGGQERLIGRKLSEELILEAAAASAGPARPMDNTDFPLEWRKKMARVYAARALREHLR